MAENEPDISYPKYLAAPPAGFVWGWVTSALIAAIAFVLFYGFREPLVEPQIIRYHFLASIGMFVLSRLCLLFPISAFGARLKHWWVDFILIIAAVVWRVMNPAAEPIILKIAAIYTLVIGAGVLARAVVTAFIDEFVHRGLPGATFKLFFCSLLITLAGGAVLALPVCWAKPVTSENRYQEAKHAINCLFTATAGFTGTGLAVLDIQEEFTQTGQIVILVLMQIGGLAMLVLASLAAWRFYKMMGWSGDPDAGRLVRFVCVLTVLCEALGGGLLYRFWEPDIMSAAFHAVSAFCNVGLTLPSDAFIGQALPKLGVMAILSSLMLIGGVGGPVLYDLCQKLKYGSGFVLPKPTRVTIVGTILLIAAGASLLLFIESTPRWQLRNPREDIPGRLKVSSSQSTDGAMVFSSLDTQRSHSERMRTMPLADRTATAIFTSISSLGGGFATVRLDESSLSSASRIVLSIWMLIGGGLGGTTGGIRIVIVYLILAAVFGKTAKGGLAVAAIVGGMLLLIAITTLLLTYRETGSLEACTFEAISASCNAGLSTGLTPQLSPEARVVLVLAMLLGRVIPLGILFRPISSLREH